MVKALGAQRESDGVVVPLIGMQHIAPEGKGTNFDHALDPSPRIEDLLAELDRDPMAIFWG